MSGIQLKLVCGGEELNLSDRSTWYPLPHREGMIDGGQTVEVKFYLEDADAHTQAITALLHRLDWFNEAAIRYYMDHQGPAVYLGMKQQDGNDYDTTFGRGWLYKRLAGTNTTDDRAIEYALPEDWAQSYNFARADALTVTFRAMEVHPPHGPPIYPWTTLQDRWVGQAQGGLTTADDGALVILPACTNLMANSQFDNEADTDNGWTVSNASLTATENTDPEFVYSGYFSFILSEDGSGNRTWRRSIAVGDVLKYSLQCRARKLDGSAVTDTDCRLFYNAGLTTTYTQDPDHPAWYWLRTENFDGIAAATNTGITVLAGMTVVVDCFQLEQRSYCTPYAYGNMGRGFSFSSTAHTSTSVRAAAGINYRNSDGTCPRILARDLGTVLIVWKAPHDNDAFGTDAIMFSSGSMVAHYDATNERFEFTDGTDTALGDGLTFSADDVLYTFFQYGENNCSIYTYNAAGTSLGTGLTVHYNSPAVNDSFWLGSDSTPAYQCEGEIQEVQAWHEELTSAQRTARVLAGRGAAELPYLWTVDAEGDLENQDDTGAGEDNWGELGNFPGDHEAGLRFMIKNTQASPFRYAYIGQARGGVPKLDIPARRLLIGNHFRPMFEGEAGAASYDGDTSTVVGAGASGGNYASTSPSNTSNVKRVNIPICNEPEDLWPYVGRFHVMGCTYTATTDRFQVQFRCTTGALQGPLTPQETADAGSIWRPLLPTNQLLSIPAANINEETAQGMRPGDWSSAADGVFCYLEYWVEASAAAGSLFLDMIALLPAGNSGWASIIEDTHWPQNRWMVISSIEQPQAAFVYDSDKERFLAGFDYAGTWFTVPPKDPVIMMVVVRDNAAGFEWVAEDTFRINAKYRPRYRYVR